MELPPHVEARIPAGARVYFFSDAHLDSRPGDSTGKREERVVAFLEHLRGRADVLVILGDLFDFYFEYRTVFPACHLRVLAGLEALSRSGVNCFYVAGNHDFWLGGLFSRTLGIKLVRDALLLVRESEPEERVLAAHGDGLGEGDTGYKLLKKILRNPWLIRLFRLIHPDWGYAIARATSHTSRKYTVRLQEARSQAADRTAENLLAAGRNLETVILAHTHQPEERRFEHGRYLNSGDWCTHYSYICWNGPGAFELRYFT